MVVQGMMFLGRGGAHPFGGAPRCRACRRNRHPGSRGTAAACHHGRARQAQPRLKCGVYCKAGTHTERVQKKLMIVCGANTAQTTQQIQKKASHGGVCWLSRAHKNHARGQHSNQETVHQGAGSARSAPQMQFPNDHKQSSLEPGARTHEQGEEEGASDHGGFFEQRVLIAKRSGSTHTKKCV